MFALSNQIYNIYFDTLFSIVFVNYIKMESLTILGTTTGYWDASSKLSSNNCDVKDVSVSNFAINKSRSESL